MSCTTNISDCDANPGMTWPILAAIGSCGWSSLRTYVDLSVDPSGMMTVTRLYVGVTFVAIVSIKKQWLVALESSTS